MAKKKSLVAAQATCGKQATWLTLWFRYIQVHSVENGGAQVVVFYHQRWGFSDKVGLAYFDAKDNSMSTNKREQIESEVDRYAILVILDRHIFTDHVCFRMLRESQDRVRELLMDHREELDLLTEALVEHETLDLKVLFPDPMGLQYGVRSRDHCFFA
jgi:hypothetical protein